MKCITVFYSISEGLDDDDPERNLYCLYKEVDLPIVPIIGDNINWGNHPNPCSMNVKSREFSIANQTIILYMEDGAYVISDLDEHVERAGWIKCTTEEFDHKFCHLDP